MNQITHTFPAQQLQALYAVCVIQREIAGSQRTVLIWAKKNVHPAHEVSQVHTREAKTP